MLTWPKGLLQLLLLHTAWKMGSGQLHYSVLEESQHGTFVGRIAQDLGLEVSELVPRMFRMLSKGEKDYFEVNLQNGILFVNSRIDREELCAKNADCVLHVEVIVEKPLRFFHVEVEIEDINDNAPIFSAREQILSIAELTTASGTLFPLEGASDADIGTNALLTYKLSPSNNFILDLGNDEDESKSVVLLLKVPLDREESPVHHLVLTATDGGEPKLTGTVQLVINVLDVNDNPPVFNQSAYRVKLLENTVSGSLVINLNATDLDEGVNREISYFFSNKAPPHVTKVFSINSDIGEIRMIGKLDYEESKFYELPIVAEDKGSSPLLGHCKVLIEVLDMNDNIPEMSVNSLSVPLPEDSPPGTVVAIISASDKDSGINGQINCFLWPTGVPFKLDSTFKNYYSLIVGAILDREQVAEYRMVVTVEDQGVPPLSSSLTILVPISDINDNAPAFIQPSYTIFVKENNPPGAHIFTMSAADPDIAENGLITYWIDEKLWPLSSYISVHSESGKLYALQSLDYEELKLLEFHVRAKDAGMPSLCGNATVQVFVMDENDNAPSLSRSSEENLILLVVPVMPGHIVGKIHALDADSGYNAWLRYELIEESNGLWSVGQYSGEVSTKYSLDESEANKIHSVLVLVKDHGKPQLSATATLSVSLVTSGQTIKMDINLQRSGENFVPLVDSINVYLIIAICSVSSLFLLAALIYVALRCHCKAKEPMVYGPGMATLVCTSEVGSWSYSNRHSHILAGVSAEAGVKSDLMIFSPNIPVFADNGELTNGVDVPPDSAKKIMGNLSTGWMCLQILLKSLFLLATLIYVALRCHCKAKEPMVYGPGMATLVCTSGVGSWSYSNRHSHILAGVNTECGAKSDLMIFSPNVPVFANNGELQNDTELPHNASKEAAFLNEAPSED
ncbi:protocadherin alpha-5-like isoform X10 [Ahaetulla prasina]|uniref:protocadherin alpha-5-like isoform X10 n=1 Tax=Ahaetulla prasina TaxID=499056 RepID=UPI00264A0860|nr:protocadherin alpha-5-like isoform X10 [Ahaetulla prasina]